MIEREIERGRYREREKKEIWEREREIHNYTKGLHYK